MKSKFSEVIQVLLYKEVPEIFVDSNFLDEALFSEPLLFAFFNQREKSAQSKAVLLEVISGYLHKTLRVQVEHLFNKTGIAFLPELGYYNRQGVKVDSVLKIDHLEVMKSSSPLLNVYFTESYRGRTIDSDPIYSSRWKEGYNDLHKCIFLLKKHLPIFYQEFTFSCKRIYLHDNPKILNFTTIETLGMLYIYVLGNNNLIYFIEELIHQGSHNYLYHIMFNKRDFFIVDAENTLMRDLTLQQWDYRTLYGAFHGLFTVSRRLTCFDKLLSEEVFTGRQKHELLGRMADMFTRFKTGLELIDHAKIFTDQGYEFYKKLTEESTNILSKYSLLTREFDLSHRDLDFRYDEFCKDNSYEDFEKKDQNGYFKF